LAFSQNIDDGTICVRARCKTDSQNCLVVQWSPNSLAGLTLGIPGGLANSHGTGGTVVGIAIGPKPGLYIQIEPDVLSF